MGAPRVFQNVLRGSTSLNIRANQISSDEGLLFQLSKLQFCVVKHQPKVRALLARNQWDVQNAAHHVVNLMGFTAFLRFLKPSCSNWYFFVGIIGFLEGSLEIKLPTIWTDEKAEVVRVKEEKRRAAERRSEKRKSQKKEDAGARKGRKVAKHCVFPMI
jgi:hypothetical protein